MKHRLISYTLPLALAFSVGGCSYKEQVTPSVTHAAAVECPVEEPCWGYESEPDDLNAVALALDIQAREAKAWEAYDYFIVNPPVTSHGLGVEYIETYYKGVPELPPTYFVIPSPSDPHVSYVFNAVMLFDA